MRALPLALLLLAPLSAAHGGTIVVPLDSGPYRVLFHTYDAITDGEPLRLAWNVTDRATGQRLAITADQARAEATYFDTRGALVGRAPITLGSNLPGFLYGDVTVGPEGKAQWDLQFPGGAVSHEQEVFPATTAGRYPEQAPTPGAPWALALPLVAGVALALRRR